MFFLTHTSCRRRLNHGEMTASISFPAAAHPASRCLSPFPSVASAHFHSEPSNSASSSSALGVLLESNSRVNYNTIHRCSAILSDGFNLDVLDADDALQIDFGCRTAAAPYDLNVECRPLWARGYLVCTCSALPHHRRKLLSYRRLSSCPGRAPANSSIHRVQSGRFFFFIAPVEEP